MNISSLKTAAGCAESLFLIMSTVEYALNYATSQNDNESFI